MIRAILTVSLIALTAFAACAGVSKVRYSPLINLNRPARSADQVEAFLTQKPPHPYQEIGILTYRAGTAEKYANVVQYMREKAAQLGADGVIMMDSSAGPSMPIGYVIATLTDYRAMAIVYKD
jgi:hypothetical protein